jgi:hypothetical protein
VAWFSVCVCGLGSSVAAGVLPIVYKIKISELILNGKMLESLVGQDRRGIGTSNHIELPKTK